MRRIERGESRIVFHLALSWHVARSQAAGGQVLCSRPDRHFGVRRGSGGHPSSQLAAILYMRSA